MLILIIVVWQQRICGVQLRIKNPSVISVLLIDEPQKLTTAMMYVSNKLCYRK
jgi:hypothetical protein